jgi:hypothetical protein
MISSDPNEYVIPSGFIELRNAVDETIGILFGKKHIKSLTKQTRASEMKKNARSKRRNAVTKLLWQALSTSVLTGYLRKGVEANILHHSYWNEPEPQWRPFLAEPLGRPGAKVFLLHKEAWKYWLTTVNWRQQKSVAIIQGKPINKPAKNTTTICSDWLEEQMAQSPNVKPQNKAHYRECALKKFPEVTKRKFDNVIWPNAIAKSGAAAWKKAGAPRKSIESPRQK